MNPARGAERKESSQITDRALRYRANANPPPGPRICCLCGSEQNIEVGHINGHEEDSSPANLFWTCRRCNILCGTTLRKAGLGRKTNQFNPAKSGAKSLGQWLEAIAVIKGESTAMPVDSAVGLIRSTSISQRSSFAKEIWRMRRARYGPSGRSDSVPF